MALIRAVAFDFGHTLVDEQRDASIPLESRAGTDLQHFLDRAGIGRFFAWVVTSVDAGFRKPAPQFFEFALGKCGLARDEVLFVGNQLNTDIAGGQSSGIRTVWLSGTAYRSTDDSPSAQGVRPTHTIHTLRQLPPLLERLCKWK